MPTVIIDGVAVDAPAGLAAALAAVAAATPPPSAPAPSTAPSRAITKLTLYARATDAELATLDYWLRNLATVRQRMRWSDAVEIDLDDPEVHQMATMLFGAERAAVLLVP